MAAVLFCQGRQVRGGRGGGRRRHIYGNESTYNVNGEGRGERMGRGLNTGGNHGGGGGGGVIR